MHMLGKDSHICTTFFKLFNKLRLRQIYSLRDKRLVYGKLVMAQRLSKNK